MGSDENEFEDGECDCEACRTGGQVPDFRATVRRSGVIRIVDWTPWLARSGPLYTLIAARGRAGVGIADLTVVRDEAGNAGELLVDFLCGGSSVHRAALRDWAAYVGYRCVWFNSEVVDFEPVSGGVAQTRCSGCGARWVDGTAGFWTHVRERGVFPTWCVLCGSDLPRWTPACQTSQPGGDPGVSDNVRSTACK